MSLIVKGSSREDFEKIPLGAQHAVCAHVEEVGTHEQTFKNATKMLKQVVLVFELAHIMKQGPRAGQPFIIGKIYTMSLDSKANLSKDIESWFSFRFTKQHRKEGFDLHRLIGKNCMLSIVEQETFGGETYHRINAIMSLPQGAPQIQPSGAPCPEWVQKYREQSMEWLESNKQQNFVDAESNDDDLPF